MVEILAATLLCGAGHVQTQGTVMGGASVSCYHDDGGALYCYSNSGAMCVPGYSYDCEEGADGSYTCQNTAGTEVACTKEVCDRCHHFTAYDCGSETLIVCDDDIVSRSAS